MLQITVPGIELWDEQKQEFSTEKDQTLCLEHSLVSISKWESKWNKIFLDNKEPKSYEETLDYIRCMTLTQNVKPEVYARLTEENFKQINEYIEAPMTATTFFENHQGGSNREKISSELVYYWMVTFNIPFECQKWHLNRLLTLIRICNVKNAPPKKMSKRDVASQYASLNAARRKQMNSRG